MYTPGLKRKNSRFGREVTTIIAVAMREIVLFIRSPFMVVMSFGLPLIMMGMIGGNMMGLPGGEGLGPFMLVGMMVNMLFMVTAMGMTSLVADGDTDFNQEMLVAPISRYSLVTGKILGASFGAIVSLFGTIIVGLIMGIMLPIGQLLMILVLSPLMCFAGGALSMIVVGLIKSTRAVQPAVSLIIMPQMFLSGAIIPINESSMILSALSRAMPMTYCLDLARTIAGIGEPMFDIWLNFAAISTITIVCLVIGTFFFARSGKNK